MCKKQSEFNVWRCLFFSVVSMIIIIAGIIIICNGISLDISSEKLVLTFVGILATFVVISNYAIVQQTKQEFENKFNDIKNIEDKNKSILFEVKNAQIGICMLHAESYKKENSISSLVYYLKAIYIGLDNAIEEKSNLITGSISRIS